MLFLSVQECIRLALDFGKFLGETCRMAKELKASSWDEELVRRVGSEVKRLRGKRSATWLSDRTHELGRRVPVSVIAKLDSGHRGSVLNVAELIVLAAALGVPPVSLLYPLESSSDEVDALPDWPVRTWDALTWFTGEASLKRDLDLDSRDTLIIENVETGAQLTDQELSDEGFLDLEEDPRPRTLLQLRRERDRVSRALGDALVREVLSRDAGRADLTEARRALSKQRDEIVKSIRELEGESTSNVVRPRFGRPDMSDAPGSLAASDRGWDSKIPDSDHLGEESQDPGTDDFA